MKKLLCIIMSVVVLLSGMSVAYGDSTDGTDSPLYAYITVENTVYPKSAGAEWDGRLIDAYKVDFKDGESVFSVTHRVLKQNKIHFEFTDNPMYSSVYVEGISNIYEFDCGDLSGWMYSVNGVFPNYGCSGYRVKAGDIIEWKYTCNLGEDVGNRFCGGRQQKK